MDLYGIFEIQIVKYQLYNAMLVEYLNFFIRNLNVVVFLLVKFVIRHIKLIENFLKFVAVLELLWIFTVFIFRMIFEWSHIAGLFDQINFFDLVWVIFAWLYYREVFSLVLIRDGQYFQCSLAFKYFSNLISRFVGGFRIFKHFFIRHCNPKADFFSLLVNKKIWEFFWCD